MQRNVFMCDSRSERAQRTLYCTFTFMSASPRPRHARRATTNEGAVLYYRARLVPFLVILKDIPCMFLRVATTIHITSVRARFAYTKVQSSAVKSTTREEMFIFNFFREAMIQLYGHFGGCNLRLYCVLLRGSF